MCMQHNRRCDATQRTYDRMTATETGVPADATAAAATAATAATCRHSAEGTRGCSPIFALHYAVAADQSL